MPFPLAIELKNCLARHPEDDPAEILERVRFASFVRTGAEPTKKELAEAIGLLRKYNPDQPRVPAGNPGGGQWTSGGSGAGADSFNLADVIRVCVASAISRSQDAFGNMTYRAWYDCIGGQTIMRDGFGTAPGLIRDPFF